MPTKNARKNLAGGIPKPGTSWETRKHANIWHKGDYAIQESQGIFKYTLWDTARGYPWSRVGSFYTFKEAAAMAENQTPS